MWYLDSGCSRHMTGDKAMFVNLTSHNGGDVTFGDNNKGKVVGIGNVVNKSLSISDVLYVKGLKHNLLSISQLCDKGYDIKFEADRCIVREDLENISFVASRYMNIYTTNLNDLHD